MDCLSKCHVTVILEYSSTISALVKDHTWQFKKIYAKYAKYKQDGEYHAIIFGAIHGSFPGFYGLKPLQKHSWTHQQKINTHTLSNIQGDTYPTNYHTTTVSETTYQELHTRCTVFVDFGVMCASTGSELIFLLSILLFSICVG